MKERTPLGNVVVATDFSSGATSAIERAARLPLAPSSTLTVLHVIAADSSSEERREVGRQLDRTAAAAVDAAARAGRKGLRVVPRLLEGRPYVEIVRYAHDEGSELVVIGRHGRRTFRDLLLGSTAERVIRKGATPVLVTAVTAVRPYERPLAAIDLSHSAYSALELIWRLTAPHVETLELVHACAVVAASALRDLGCSGAEARRFHREAEKKTRGAIEGSLAFSAIGIPTKLVVREGDARSVILDLAAERDCDLLALGTHGRSGLAHALIGSVAEAVVRAAQCDVLVARPLELPFSLP